MRPCNGAAPGAGWRPAVGGPNPSTSSSRSSSSDPAVAAAPRPSASAVASRPGAVAAGAVSAAVPPPAAPSPAPRSSGVSYGLLCSPASIAACRLRPNRAAGRWPVPASPSCPSACPRPARPRSSASRSGTRCSGVPVMTSRPNAQSSASSGAATHGVTTATSGAETAYPMKPPAARIAADPSAGVGVPWAMCSRPRAPMSRADPPIVSRPVSALRSGWRRNRQASSASSTGTSQASEPNAPCTSSVMIRLALPRCHQVVAATTIAAPRKARPTPSRRCSGSRSRALRPRARAPAPAAWANSIHTPDTARATQPMKIMIGSVCGADRRFERPRPRPPLDPPRVFLPLPEPLRVDPRPGGMLLVVRERPPEPG